MELKKMEGAIEAILFAIGEAVPLKDIAKTIGHDTETTRKIIRNMMLKYKEEDRGIQIIELENAFQMCTKEAAKESCAFRCNAGNTVYYRVQTACHQAGD